MNKFLLYNIFLLSLFLFSCNDSKKPSVTTPPSSSNCKTGYHLENNKCVPNTRNCVPNGEGSQTWENDAWGACTFSSCNTNYHEEGGFCVSNTRSCDIIPITEINSTFLCSNLKF